mmetsp:Transcript_50324/g.133627  ORF Transcript_50324/g.133627 Transcript_50324/m.133627 type:complete len:238 (-) Transcript_50324:838-1551(-)
MLWKKWPNLFLNCFNEVAMASRGCRSSPQKPDNTSTGLSGSPAFKATKAMRSRRSSSDARSLLLAYHSFDFTIWTEGREQCMAPKITSALNGSVRKAKPSFRERRKKVTEGQRHTYGSSAAHRWPRAKSAVGSCEHASFENRVKSLRSGKQKGLVAKGHPNAPPKDVTCATSTMWCLLPATRRDSTMLMGDWSDTMRGGGSQLLSPMPGTAPRLLRPNQRVCDFTEMSNLTRDGPTW